MWNLVVETVGGKEAEGVWEHGVEENIWTYERRGNGGMEEIAQRGVKWFVLLTLYFAGDKIEKNEMGWACDAYGLGERGIYGLGGETGGKETTGET